MSDDGVPECLDCGACCCSAYPRHVVVRGEDHAVLLPEELERYTVWLENVCVLGRVEGRCAALDVRTGRAVCRIYPRRPEPCRSFARGSDACAQARERHRPLGTAS
ncbi:MAG: YkgJ family cysteine cluster protein [Planctomycetota bacterium]|nr:MAG: YkgJ family cysteine cluster protein [Planctomycetota bacterium]